RQKLKAGTYWRSVDTEIHLGYRKGARAGRWLVHQYLGDQKYAQQPIGNADDESPADGLNVLSFNQAKNTAVDLVAERRAETAMAAAGEIPTVGSDVENYMAARDARHLSMGGNGKSDARRRLSRHVMSDATLSAIQLHTLSVDALRRWVKGLPASLEASTLRRISNDFKAALNAAAEAHRER